MPAAISLRRTLSRRALISSGGIRSAAIPQPGIAAPERGLLHGDRHAAAPRARPIATALAAGSISSVLSVLSVLSVPSVARLVADRRLSMCCIGVTTIGRHTVLIRERGGEPGQGRASSGERDPVELSTVATGPEIVDRASDLGQQGSDTGLQGVGCGATSTGRGRSRI